MEELPAGDLGQPDRADVAHVLAERAVHLLVDPLRLERHVLEVRLALHRPVTAILVTGLAMAVMSTA
ncbi:hypothetical protein BJF86_15295 [Serinicoccus sp. CNJ-927]|nr:hypothetical protein BJF86_15295 [Serinicoccus sp. CNJ-927]